MNSAETAATTFRILPYGSDEACSENELIKPCTVEMIEWWFHRIGGTMNDDGANCERWLVWHPKDHIRWELAKPGLNSRAEVGAKFKIAEDMGSPAEDKLSFSCHEISPFIENYQYTFYHHVQKNNV